jgi:hypothetical protein
VVHVELWYEQTLVGRVSEVVSVDGGLMGVIQFSISDATEQLGREVQRFVDFCIDWNERTRAEDPPPSASEFDAFGTLAQSGKWYAVSGGVLEVIETAPVFFKGNEVSWRTKPRLVSLTN